VLEGDDIFAVVIFLLLAYFYVFALLVAKEVVYVLLCVYAAKSIEAIIIFMIFIVYANRLVHCGKLFRL